MELAPYVESLRRELAVAAAAGGEDARVLGERLAAALESAATLALLEALSFAADEITRDLAPGSVEVRLRGRDPAFVVTPPPTGLHEGDTRMAPATPAPPVPPAPEADEGGTSRISLRVPEHLKPRIEDAASRAGLSVNAWLVRAVTSALEPERHPTPSNRGQRFTGWVQ
ncbi:hypothetical protein GCM10009555_091660 [Acrocarpospora macrocephala]|uniref:Histidine kinase n=1 Tax=Acrocarpospora macrocephala TaxID=150177 RepID=A0A5M3WM68_9ACTN|nr:hypothetical protein [Acrocarpospora macrocephala]GES09142.1 hypothetical protein Amac_027380 [Acrocarpospora macrocephala]